MGFADQVRQWASSTQEAVERVIRDSTKEVVMEMTKPTESVNTQMRRGIPREGAVIRQGFIPVDTGFLRASLMTSTSSMPLIVPGKAASPRALPESYPFDLEGVLGFIESSPLDKTMYFGFTAAYAAVIEYGFGGFQGYAFVRLASQRWPGIVERNKARIKSEMGL